jgi:hypothetical protein
MKTRLLTIVCASAIGLCSVTSGSAGDSGEAANVAVDVVLVRPAFLIVTVVGTACFLVSLPVTAATKTAKATGHTMVVMPAKSTFTRPLGDLEGVVD